MKKAVLIIVGIFIFSGCATKVIIKKDNTLSVGQQKHDAKKAWNGLDKEK